MKILILSTVLKEQHRDRILEVAHQYGAEVCFSDKEQSVPADFEDPDILYGFGMNIAKRSKKLKWLCVPSAGVDYLMKPGTFANEECILTNSAGAYGVTIAEHIIAVSLMMMRRITLYYEESLQGNWAGKRYPQSSLKGSRITVLGTGDIGTNFAVRAKAFEPATLIGVNRSGTNDNPVYDQVLSISSLDSVLPETDLLVMSIPSTSETIGILDRKRIAALPEGAYVVNVGRGTAIDEDALADALEEGHLAGAALDVFQTEPLPAESRLWKTPNLLITPHVAGNLTLQYTLEKNIEMFLSDLVAYMEGRPLEHVVDRTKGY